MMFFKRAVSPLIATVLLVMITVSIGAAVMVVIQNVAQDGIQSTVTQNELIKCGSDVSAEVLTVSSSYRICINAIPTATTAGNFTLFLENTGLKDISAWRVMVIGESGVYDASSQGLALSKGAIAGMRFSFNGTGPNVANVSTIRLAPEIDGGGSGTITCIEPNLEFISDSIENWDLCSAVTWDNNI